MRLYDSIIVVIIKDEHMLKAYMVSSLKIQVVNDKIHTLKYALQTDTLIRNCWIFKHTPCMDTYKYVYIYIIAQYFVPYYIVPYYRALLLSV